MCCVAGLNNIHYSIIIDSRPYKELSAPLVSTENRTGQHCRIGRDVRFDNRVCSPRPHLTSLLLLLVQNRSSYKYLQYACRLPAGIRCPSIVCLSYPHRTTHHHFCPPTAAAPAQPSPAPVLLSVRHVPTAGRLLLRRVGCARTLQRRQLLLQLGLEGAHVRPTRLLHLIVVVVVVGVDSREG